MTVDPVITVIIPTYERMERLKKAIKSVLNQTYPYLKICIYDNASTDATGQLVAELMSKDSRISYHRHPVNIGAVENMQFAMDRVTTPFFSFLADDDYLLPHCYEITMNGFYQHPEAVSSLGAVFEIEEEGSVIQVPLRSWSDCDCYAAPNGLIEMIGKYSNWTGALFRTELVKTIGPLDLTVKAVDVDYMFRVAAQFPIAISKKGCAVFVQHPSSYSSSHGLKVYWPGWQTMMYKIQQAESIPLEIRNQAVKLLTRDLAQALLMTTARLIEQKQFLEAAQALEILIQQSGCGKKEQFLQSILRLSQKVAVVHLLFSKALILRRFWNRCVRNAELQREFEELKHQANL